jgi:uncharacterized protein
MRILACSDLHCDLDATRRICAAATGQGAEVVVIAGDIADKGAGADPLLAAFRALPMPVVIVPGNHDRLTELQAFCRDWSGGHLLHGAGVSLRGVNFFGLGGEIPSTHADVWNLAVPEARAAQELAKCPPGALLVTHSPPQGVADRRENGRHGGSTSVLDALRRARPRLHLCGHIHAAWGQSGTVGDTPVHNLGPFARVFEV